VVFVPISWRLNDPVDRDELTDHDLPHVDLPYLFERWTSASLARELSGGSVQLLANA
jgi:hypothetical protein